MASTIKIPNVGQKGYSRPLPLGNQDFLSVVRAYTPAIDGASFVVETYRTRTALVKINFVSAAAFRLRMYPFQRENVYENAVFDFPGFSGVTLVQDDTFVTLRTDRVTLKIRLCPWEMSVELDGRPLTREQIRDFNVDSLYKALPLGFSLDSAGNVSGAFETMYLHTDESFYGFGEKFTDFDKRGQQITVWQRDALSTNSNVSYKGMPYFMSSAGYSVLLNTFTRTHFDMGATSGVSYTMTAEDPYLDYYMFCNRDYKGLLRDYTALSGRSPLLPRWAFGLWMSKMSYMSRKEVEDVVKRAEDFGLSFDVVHIDGWMSFLAMGALTFDTDRFPQPEEMIADLKKKGVHLSLWMFPYVPKAGRFADMDLDDPALSPEMRERLRKARENPQVPLFDQLAEKGYLVKKADGTPCTFIPTEAGAEMGAIDFTNPAAVAWISEAIGKLMRMGVGVIKTDFSEELPEDAVYYDGTTGVQGHNRYTFLYAKTIYEASRAVKEQMGQRPMLWGRSGYAGSQNYPANWAGDSSSHTNNLSAILKGGLSIALSGVSYWGYDIGGFYNTDYQGNVTRPTDEEYIRSAQMGLMAPLSRFHGQETPREPWGYSPEAQKAFLKVNKLRYRMLPYVYSTAYETHLEGIPMMRAMLLEFPEDLNTRNISTQYMLGGCVLVAPVFDQQVQHIYLPAGSWTDLLTGERIAGNRWITHPITLDSIPLYLRENTIVPMLRTAPSHIPEENFRRLTVTMNITGSIDASYYDDGFAGSFQAILSGSTLAVTTDMDVAALRVYAPQDLSGVTLNGNPCAVKAAGGGVYEVSVS